MSDQYDLTSLSTWVQRPQAVTKCFVSDVYGLKALIGSHLEPNTYSGRDVYMLDKWPCRMVELVAWVAGVDHKEKTMIVTIDDGDGQHVLPVTIYLPSRKIPVTSPKKVSQEASSTNTFSTRGERKAFRKQAEVVSRAKLAQKAVPTYVRKDVRVGDVVRIIGRVNEYPRRKPHRMEWVREVVVDEGSGGSIVVVDQDEQYIHRSTVLALHRTRYSQRFQMPAPPPTLNYSIDITRSSCPSSPTHTFSELASSEIGELDLEVGEVRLRDPSKLRSSQLTDATFRQYALDYMTRETMRFIESTLDPGSIFPEYLDMVSSNRATSSRIRIDSPPWCRSRQSSPYSPSLTLPDLLNNPTVYDLARLVVDNVTRKEEKRRRRRIREGTPRPVDLEIELERKRLGRDWRLTPSERSLRMERLVGWVIRDLHQDGCIVHLESGYVPLPPELLWSVVRPHMEREMFLRENVFMKKNDPRRGNGIGSGDLVKRLQGWGVEGRWERIQGWSVDDALTWAEARGMVKKMGKGWVLVPS